MNHDHGGHQPHGFHVCARLAAISAPFDAGQRVELKFEVAGCHGLMPGGILLLPIAANQAPNHKLGDEISIRVRYI